MKTSVTVTFSVLFLAVGALYIRLNPGSMSGVPSASDTLLRILPLLNDGGVRWMEIRNSENKENIILEKKSEGWRIVAPVSYPADPLMAEGLSTATKAKIFPTKLSLQDWHTLVVQTKGDELSVSIDGKPVGSFKSPGVTHDTKSLVSLTTNQVDVHYDDFSVKGVAK